MKNTGTMKKRIFLAAPLILLLSLSGCAKPPVEAMDAADAAVTRAENDPDAAAYAGSVVTQARSLLDAMRAAAAAKRYDAAKAYADDAVRAAEKAVADGRAGAARAKDEAAGLLALLPEMIADTERNVQAALRAKLAADFQAIGRDLESARRAADQAVVAAAADRYQEALEKGRSVRSVLDEINARISGAASAASRKK
jgi:hypothetical protein